MAQQNMTPEEQLLQLRDARKLVLSDVKYYPNIVQVVLPILASTSGSTVRRWVADFIAEAFASPALPSKDKETLSLLVLEHLKQTLERPKEDPYVLKSVIMAAASIYSLAMRWIINNSYDTPTWERLAAIKSRIFRLWDESPTSIKICCVKFTQRVVLAQTATNIESQRRDGLEVSLAMVPPGHTLLDPRNLEAEATGLLDRMLGALQDNSSDALVVDATLNCLSILVRTRPSTSGRIMNAVLNFNPLKLANSPMTPKTRVLVKSMEKTTRMLLIHLSKRDPNNAFAPRIQQYVERLLRSRSEIFEDASRKRAFAEQQAAYQEAKRQRMNADVVVPQVQIQPLAPGPNSLAAIFTLTGNTGLQGFDAAQVPPPIAARVAVSTLARLDPQILSMAVTGIRERLASLATQQAQAINPDTAPLGVEDDDDDYEPDYYAAEDTEQILNKLDGEAQEEQAPKLEAANLALGAFKLPPAPSLNPDVAAQAGQGTVTRVFGAMQQLEDPIVKKSKAGINRLAASSYDRDSWLTVITRLATRASAGLENVSVKDENGSALADRNRPSLSNAIREMLYNYVLEDFRKRIEVAVAWLCEEWYNDALQKRYSSDAPLHYEKWALKLVDGFFPYLNPQDKVLTRFLGEIPEVNAAILARVTKLCRDPSMVQLSITSLLYLVMMKPPARILALNTVQDIWLEYEDARPMAGKVLTKWRPGFVESHSGAAGGMPSGAGNVAVAT